jgi:hypothetical protein
MSSKLNSNTVNRMNGLNNHFTGGKTATQVKLVEV